MKKDLNGNKWYEYIDKYGNIHKCQGSYELIFAYILFFYFMENMYLCIS